jgi:hypothetical protein
MRINKIVTSYSRTVAMRQYESVNVFLSIEASVDPGESVRTVTNQAKRIAKEEVEEEVKKLKRERLESRDDEMEKAA